MRADFRLLALAPVLVLAACQGDSNVVADGAVAGEVLPGSTSDAMLPYDQIKSQPPMAPRSEASGGSGKGPDAKKPDSAD